MALGGNPEELRTLARRLRTDAGEVGHTATRVRQGQGIHWVGLAAERYRGRLREHGAQIDRTRDEILTAASRLDELADALEERQRAIARAMDLVDDALTSARDTIGRFAGDVWDTLTGAEKAAEETARDLLDSVRELPSPGHPDWVDLARRIGR